MSFRRLVAIGAAAALTLTPTTLLPGVATAAPTAPMAGGKFCPAQPVDASGVQQLAAWLTQSWDQNQKSYSNGALADLVVGYAAAGGDAATLQTMATQLASQSKAGLNAGLSGKFALAAMSAGADPRAFGGVDLIAEIQAGLAKDPLGGGIFNTGYAVAALVRAGAPVPETTIDALASKQQAGGYWGFGSSADVDSTGVILTALAGLVQSTPAQKTKAQPIIDKAATWAESVKVDDSYWPGYSPVNATAMVAPAMELLNRPQPKAYAFMLGQQRLTKVGAFSNTLNGTTPNGMASTQAAPYLAGRSMLNAGQDCTQTPQPEPTLSASSAGSKQVNQYTAAWGTLTNAPAGTPVSTQVLLNGQNWSTSQVRPTQANGSYVIPLTYGASTPGSYQFRTIATVNGRTVTSPTFTLVRTPVPAPSVRISATTAGTKPVGQYTGIWGQVSGAPSGSPVTSQVLVNGRWSTSQQRSTNASGGYTIPLTYGANTAGTYQWRVVTVVRGVWFASPTQTLVRR